MTIIRHIPWTEQPQGAVEVALDNPLVNGLRGLWVASSSGVTQVLPTLASVALESGGRVSPTSRGYEITSAAASRRALIPDSPIWQSTAAITVLHFCSPPNDGGVLFSSETSNNGFGIYSNRFYIRIGGAWVDIPYLTSESQRGVPTTAGGRYDGATVTTFADGIESFSSATSGSITHGTSGIGLGATASGGSASSSGANNLLAIWNRPLTNAEILFFHHNPWQLFSPRTQRIWGPPLGGAYTLNAETGVYTFTGSNATLLHNYALTLESASYSLTGSNATLLKGLILDAASGSYTLTGSNATLVYNKLLNASSGSYSITGADANLIYTPTAGAYVLNAESGAYVLTGSDVTFSYSGGTITLKAGSWIRYRIIT